MDSSPTNQTFKPLGRWQVALWAALAIATFHLAFLVDGWFIAGFLLGVFQLAHMARGRDAFRVGMVVGWLCYGPQLLFFWTIFDFAAVALWSVLAFWLAVFLALLRVALLRFGPLAGSLLAPVLWLGTEFFRSELYYLRFTWVTPGFAVASIPPGGAYGVGFWLMLAISICAVVQRFGRGRWWLIGGTAMLLPIVASLVLPMMADATTGRQPLDIRIAGLQILQPHPTQLLPHLDKIVADHPETELVVLGEYAFDGPVPDKVRDWCARNRRHLIAGGKDEYGTNSYYNTAFVIDTNGAVVFKQAKSVPVQFFKDGTPATNQRVWESPWGKIGLGICYDLSYARVMDELIRQGAQAIIIPTMDMNEWGRHQQEMHTRVARVRSAEYGVSILRICSEGISQLVNRRGPSKIAASNAEGEVLVGNLTLRRHVSARDVPFDRMLAWPAVVFTGGFAVWCAVETFRRRRTAVAA